MSRPPELRLQEAWVPHVRGESHSHVVCHVSQRSRQRSSTRCPHSPQGGSGLVRADVWTCLSFVLRSLPPARGELRPRASTWGSSRQASVWGWGGGGEGRAADKYLNTLSLILARGYFPIDVEGETEKHLQERSSGWIASCTPHPPLQGPAGEEPTTKGTLSLSLSLSLFCPGVPLPGWGCALGGGGQLRAPPVLPWAWRSQRGRKETCSDYDHVAGRSGGGVSTWCSQCEEPAGRTAQAVGTGLGAARWPGPTRLFPLIRRPAPTPQPPDLCSGSFPT